MTPRELFLVTPPAKEVAAQTEQTRLGFLAAAQRDGLEVKSLRARRIRDLSQSSRKLLVLDPWDAHKIYVDSHRKACAVVQLGAGIRVALNPAKGVSTRNTITLERFVRYKALLLQRDEIADVETALAAFETWQARQACGGDRDPRVLPLHCFSPSSDWVDLASSTVAFEHAHGGPNHLVDEDRRQWKRTNANHGQEALTIGGASLRAGFHWDVTSGSAGSLATTIEVWRFDTESYANVYPDGAVRQGQRAGRRARRVFQLDRPADLVKQPKANRGRKRHR